MWPEHLQRLQRQLGLEDWDAACASKGSLFVWNLAFDADQFEGWRLVSAQGVILPRDGRLLSTIWKPEGGEPGAGVRLDVASHRSRDAARQAFLQRLAGAQIPGLKKREVLDVGEIAFTSEGGQTVVFLRGNIVAELAQLGPEESDTLGVAQQLDDLLTADTEALPPPARLPVARLAAAESVTKRPRQASKVGTPVRLCSHSDYPGGTVLAMALRAAPEAPLPGPVPDEVLMGPAEERPSVLKFFATSGEVVENGDGFAYLPEAEGEQAVKLVAVAPSRRKLEREEWTFEVAH